MRKYLVGGAVRDKLLNKPVHDRDWLIVGASQSDIDKMLQDGYKQVGAAFPVFLHPETGEEHALARIERKSGTGYLGFTVETKNVTLEQDLNRRDFTFNAMAFDAESDEIIDPYGGKNDLANGIIRHVSEAFAEDPLRVFRAARFAARYEFNVHESTMALMRKIVDAGEIQHLSKERLVKEMRKILSQGKNSLIGLKVLHECGALEIFSKDFDELLMNDPTNDVFTYDVTEEAAHLKIAMILGLNKSKKLVDVKDFRKYLQSIKLPDDAVKLAVAVAEYPYPESIFKNASPEELYIFIDTLGFIKSGQLANDYATHTTSSAVGTIAEYLEAEFAFIYTRVLEAFSSIDARKLMSEQNLSGKELGAAIKNMRIAMLKDIYTNK